MDRQGMTQETTSMQRSTYAGEELVRRHLAKTRTIRPGGINDQAFPRQNSLIRNEGARYDDGIRVLHIVPFIYFYGDYEYLGSCKDIDGRQQYLKQSGVAFDTFCHLKDRCELGDELSFFTLPEYTHIIVDLSKRGRELAYLKRRWPKAKLIVRSHNPELMHRVDYLRAWLRTKHTGQDILSSFLNIGVYLKRELAVARHADAVLHIETQNTAWYWRALGFRGDTLITPYYTSDHYLEAIARNRKRRKQIVCLASSHPGPLIAEMVANYHRAVDAIGDSHRDYVFYATGDLPDNLKEADISARVQHIGLVDDVLSLLSETFAVAVLSDLGRGFKTKILEAVSCGAWVIVTPALMRRMPEVLKPFCAVADPRKAESGLTDAIDALSARSWPAHDPNEVLREVAYHALDIAIFDEPAKAQRPAGDVVITGITARSVS